MYNACEKSEKRTKFWWDNLKRGGHLRDIVIDGKIRLSFVDPASQANQRSIIAFARGFCLTLWGYARALWFQESIGRKLRMKAIDSKLMSALGGQKPLNRQHSLTSASIDLDISEPLDTNCSLRKWMTLSLLPSTRPWTARHSFPVGKAGFNFSSVAFCQHGHVISASCTLTWPSLRNFLLLILWFSSKTPTV